MTKIVILLCILLVIIGSAFVARAGTECTTRQSGSITITTCTDSKTYKSTQCRSYMSGSVRKTSCS